MERLADLSRKLFAIGVLQCSVCKQFPITPLWLSADQTNVCNSCYELNMEAYKLAIPNSTLDQIIEKMMVRCEHSDKGCTEIMKYSLYHEHSSKCSYAQTCLIDRCQWTGIRRDLIRHLCDDHPEIVIHGEHDMFPITCTGELLDTVNVVQTTVGEFITRTLTSLEKLHVAIYSEQFDSSTGEFMMQFPSSSSSVANVKCVVSEDIDCLTSPEAKFATGVSFDEMLGTPPSVQLIFKSEEFKHPVPRQLLSYYKCHMCGNFISTVKWGCFQGHQVYVCDQCSSNADRKCHGKHSRLIKILETQNIRCSECLGLNISWEHGTDWYMCDRCTHLCGGSRRIQVRLSSIPKGLIYEFIFPCCFESRGCKFVGGLPRDHENFCDYREITCPIASCGTKYRFDALFIHIRKRHNDLCVFQNSDCFNTPLKEKNGLEFYFICYNTLFVHTFQTVSLGPDVYQWNVKEVLGKKNSGFIFTVRVNGPKSLCLKMTSYCGEPLAFTNDMCNQFANEDSTVAYWIQITRKEQD